MAHGQCLCGDISYTYEEDSMVSAFHCHCKDCQRVTGSGKATVGMFPDSAVSIDGEFKTYASIGTDGSHVKRGFCPTCGSQMFTFVKEIPGHTFIKAGGMDNSDHLNVALNCWTKSASAWSMPDDNVPGVEANPPVASD